MIETPTRKGLEFRVAVVSVSFEDASFSPRKGSKDGMVN